jgi:hypothetical protein
MVVKEREKNKESKRGVEKECRHRTTKGKTIGWERRQTPQWEKQIKRVTNSLGVWVVHTSGGCGRAGEAERRIEQRQGRIYS